MQPPTKRTVATGVCPSCGRDVILAQHTGQTTTHCGWAAGQIICAGSGKQPVSREPVAAARAG